LAVARVEVIFYTRKLLFDYHDANSRKDLKKAQLNSIVKFDYEVMEENLMPHHFENRLAPKSGAEICYYNKAAAPA
jgi:hypothetical protein